MSVKSHLRRQSAALALLCATVLIAPAVAQVPPEALPGARLINPVAPGADPTIVFKDGWYYGNTSGSGGISKSRTLSDLFNAEPSFIQFNNPFRGNAPQIPTGSDPASTRYWQNSGRLVNIDNVWYFYTGWWGDVGEIECPVNCFEELRMIVLSNSNPDPTQGTWTFEKRIELTVGSGNTGETPGAFAIDGFAYQTPDGKLYFVYSGNSGGADNRAPKNNAIFAIRMQSPTRIASSFDQNRRTGLNGQAPSLLFRDSVSWDRLSVGFETVEGPEFLNINGRLHVTYSANNIGTVEYSTGLVTFTGDFSATNPSLESQFLNSSNWQKFTPQPVLAPYCTAYAQLPGCVLTTGRLVTRPSPSPSQLTALYQSEDFRVGNYAIFLKDVSITSNQNTTCSVARVSNNGVAQPLGPLLENGSGFVLQNNRPFVATSINYGAANYPCFGVAPELGASVPYPVGERVTLPNGPFTSFAGLNSPILEAGSYDDQSPSIQYFRLNGSNYQNVGSWEEFDVEGARLDNETFTRTANDQIRFEFRGRQALIFGTRAFNGGRAEGWIGDDDTVPTELNYRTNTTANGGVLPRSVIWDTGDLGADGPNATDPWVIYLTAGENFGSGNQDLGDNGYVGFDGVRILSEPITALSAGQIDDANRNLIYTDFLSQSSRAAANRPGRTGDTESCSNKPFSSVQFTFNGRSLQLRGLRYSGGGSGRIVIDNGAQIPFTAFTNGPASAPPVVLASVTGLAPGLHTAQIYVDASGQTAAGFVCIDRVDIGN